MRFIRTLFAVAAFAPFAAAQEFPKPGAEHELLKKQAGEWDYVMKFGDVSTKGKMSAKMDLGGLWLVCNYDGEVFGQKFQGRGMDSYDASKKKYVSVWIDNMTTLPMNMEGTYDKDKKTFTMSGMHPGMDGKLAEYKMVTVWKDDDHFTATMTIGKDSAFSIEYTRKK